MKNFAAGFLAGTIAVVIKTLLYLRLGLGMGKSAPALAGTIPMAVAIRFTVNEA